MGYVLGILVALSGGFLVSAGVVALTVGLKIFNRLAGISRTVDRLRFYESAVVSGSILATLLTVFFPEKSRFLQWFGYTGLSITGLFWGMFVGCWILALAEMIQIFPVYTRWFGIKKGISWMILALAFGKGIGSLVQLVLHPEMMK